MGVFLNSLPSEGGLLPLDASAIFGQLDDLGLYFWVGAKQTGDDISWQHSLWPCGLSWLSELVSVLDPQRDEPQGERPPHWACRRLVGNPSLCLSWRTSKMHANDEHTALHRERSLRVTLSV